MRAHPRPCLHMSSDFAQGHQCCSERHGDWRSTSAQGFLHGWLWASWATSSLTPDPGGVHFVRHGSGAQLRRRGLQDQRPSARAESGT
eukprot:6732733-Alexandrium_andersonii.AAC.1